MRRIKLKQCYVLVDDQDYERVCQFKWALRKGGYIYHNSRSKGLRFGMHNLILNYFGPLVIDHINRKPWDNRRKNLRICTQSVNMMNRSGPPCNNTTGYIGVCKTRWGWQSYVTLEGRRRHLGYYQSAGKAARVRNQWLKDPTQPLPRKDRRADNTSGVTGVVWHKQVGKWYARLWNKGKATSLGLFDTLEEAKAARERACCYEHPR